VELPIAAAAQAVVNEVKSQVDTLKQDFGLERSVLTKEAGLVSKSAGKRVRSWTKPLTLVRTEANNINRGIDKATAKLSKAYSLLQTMAKTKARKMVRPVMKSRAVIRAMNGGKVVRAAQILRQPSRKSATTGGSSRSSYSVAAPAAMGGWSTVSLGATHQRIQRSEMFLAVLAQSSYTNLLSMTPLTPSNGQLCPWLVGLASNYQSYRWNSMTVRYKPRSATSSTGEVIIGTYMDITTLAPATYATAVGLDGVAVGSVWCAGAKRVDVQTIQDRKHYNTGVGYATAAEPTEWYSGILNVAVDGCSATAGTQIGELWIDYDITFITPQSQLEGSLTSFYAAGATYANTTSTLDSVLTAYCGVGTTIQARSASTGSLQASAFGNGLGPFGVDTTGHKLYIYVPSGTWAISLFMSFATTSATDPAWGQPLNVSPSNAVSSTLYTPFSASVFTSGSSSVLTCTILAQGDGSSTSWFRLGYVSSAGYTGFTIGLTYTNGPLVGFTQSVVRGRALSKLKSPQPAHDFIAVEQSDDDEKVSDTAASKALESTSRVTTVTSRAAKAATARATAT